MENSIELIWKQGFLNESSLVAPKINDLYNQKSIHVVDRIKRKMKIQKKVAITLISIVPVAFYFLGAFWYGVAFSTLGLIVILRYTLGRINNLITLNQGATCYEYIKSFDRCLKDLFLKIDKIGRFTVPLYAVITNSAVWAIWNKFEIVAILQQRNPDVNVALIMLSFLGVHTLLAILFPVKILRWERRMAYGRLLDKLEGTIAEMEKLKQGE